MPFNFTDGPLKDLKIIEPKQFQDSRGIFMEVYKKRDFKQAGIDEDFVQYNHSISSKNVLRGLHFQTGAQSQGKLVKVVRGLVWDVAVDLRKDSSTYKQSFGLELSEYNKRLVYIPQGFAHGFLSMEDNTHFLYYCTEYYSPEHDGGIYCLDDELAIQWPSKDFDLSDKDAQLPSFVSIEDTLNWR
jgi:dTDP-4-dehydrorhamnose 3,5-epimerase